MAGLITMASVAPNPPLLLDARPQAAEAYGAAVAVRPNGVVNVMLTYNVCAPSMASRLMGAKSARIFGLGPTVINAPHGLMVKIVTDVAYASRA